MNPVLLLLIFVGSLHIEFCTSLTCEDYKRPLKNNNAVNSVSRKFLNCWGSEVEHGESDLIILIDKSGSMRQSGWNAAKDFVDALLTEVRVAFNATRIAIGTFASAHRLELNYLTKDTGPASHKCRYALLKLFSISTNVSDSSLFQQYHLLEPCANLNYIVLVMYNAG